MRSADYWAHRMEQLNEAQLGKGEAYIQNTRNEYAKAMSSIRKDINVFYQRFAINNGVDMSTARQMLKAGQLKEFKWSVDDYIKAGRENAVDQRWMKELENASIRVRMSRLEALQMQMRQHIEVLTAERLAGTQATMSGIYKDNYYRSIFELQKGIGLGSSFAKLDRRQLDDLLVTPWAPDGSNFSKRIWGDRAKLINELQTTLTHGLIRGDSSEKLITQLSERMNVSHSRAETLILTESAYFSGASRRASYIELDVERYRNVATLDKRTSDTCRTMDGSVFLVSEAQAGLNCAPFHARCRTVDIPEFEANVKHRAARDDEGKTYDVPGDMTYEQWEKQHVQGSVNEPPGDGPNRKYNPKAAYFAELPEVHEDVLDKLADTNRELARQGFKDGKETVVLIHSRSGTEIGRASGAIDTVKFTNEMHNALKAAGNNSIILTHNHPRGTRLNVFDIQNFGVYPSLSSVVAVGHDGGISNVSTLGKLVTLSMFNETMAKVAKKVDVELKTSREYDIMSTSEKVSYFNHLVLLGIVEELGWQYGEEFTAARGADWGN